MGLFSKKRASNASTTSPNLSPKFDSQSSRSTSSSPRTPSFPPKGTTQLPPPPDARTDQEGYLTSLQAVRERSRLVFEKVRRGQGVCFTLDPAKVDDVVSYVVRIIKRDYDSPYTSIPPHGRWQHFNVGGRQRLEQFVQSWGNIDARDRTRRLLDLFLVSVLLDAGAGNVWKFTTKQGKKYGRSEGLAVGSLDMFEKGMFSSDKSDPYRVDSVALKEITDGLLAEGLQVTSSNPLSGLSGRAALLRRLGSTLEESPAVFTQHNISRPGNMIDYLLSHPSTSLAEGKPVILIPTLWDVLTINLRGIWPEGRTKFTEGGRGLGDVWKVSTLNSCDDGLNSLVPFHKLTQWLCYSLLQVLKDANITIEGEHLLTALPEYRNGGLLVDTGLLTLRADWMERGLAAYRANSLLPGQPAVEVIPLFPPESDVIVEWRACTVAIIDSLVAGINSALGTGGSIAPLSLAQVLEAGTWKAGRELAEVSRPNTKEPPIGLLASDGTVF